MNPPPDSAVVAGWTCPSCGGAGNAASAYCGHCGERRPTARDRTLAGLFWQLVDSLLRVDGRVVHTVGLLFRAPGALTVAFGEGRRKRFVGPFALFLAANVVFSVVQGLSGLGILSTPLHAHAEGMMYAPLVRPLIDAKVLRRGTTAEAYAEAFDRREPTIARTLVIAMVPLLAAAAALVFARRDRSAVTHLVFALHFFAYMLLVLTVLFPLLALGLLAARPLGLVPDWGVVDSAVTLVEVAAVVLYFARAVPRVYGGGALGNAFAVAALTAAVPFLLVFHRLLAFAVAFAAT